MRYRFGPFVLDDLEATLEASGSRIVLTQKTFLTLLHLVRNPGRLVTREELTSAVWPDVVVEEGNLHWTISAIRKALAPFDAGPAIETVRGRGYRFLPPVESIAPEELVPAAPPPPAEPVAPAEPTGHVEPAGPADSGREAATKASFPSHRRRPLPFVLAAAALLALAAGALLARTGRPTRPWLQGRQTPGARLAVLGFHDPSGRSESAWIGSALTEMVSADLTAAGRLHAVSREEVGRLLRDLGITRPDTLSKDTLSKVRRSSGADLVVVGSYLVLPGTVRVDAHAQETTSGRTVATVSRTGREENLLELVAELDATLRDRLGLGKRTEEEDAAVRDSFPAALEAQRLYGAGILELRSHRWKEAIPLLEAATEIAPGMASAQRALSGAALALGRQKEAEEAAFAALKLSGDLPAIDRLEIEAHYRTVTRDWERAIQAWREVLEAAPDRLDARLALVRALQMARRVTEVESELKAIRASGGLAAEDPRVDLAEALFRERTGEAAKSLDAADRALDRARAFSSPSLSFRAQLQRITALVDLGRAPEAREAVAEARRLLQTTVTEPSFRSDLLVREGNLLNMVGDQPGARRAWLAALDLETALGRVTSLSYLHFNLSIVALVQGDLDEEEKQLREGLVACGVSGRMDCREFAYPSLARVARLRGDLAESERLGREALQISHETRNAVRERDAAHELAELQFEKGRPEEALSFRRRALALAEGQGDRLLVAFERSRLAELLASIGRPKEAATIVEEVWKSLAGIPEAPPFLSSDLLVTSSRCLLATSGPGAATEALARLEKAAGLLRGPEGNLSGWLYLRFGLARARAAQGDLSGAREVLKDLLELADRKGDLPSVLRARLWLARLEDDAEPSGHAAGRIDEIRREARLHGLVAIERETVSLSASRAPLL